ncbi:MAG: glycerol kinase GlpK [Chloroflexota bacterium]|nr:glycerol kinase GlpK [Chloroflexota bacterium]
MSDQRFILALDQGTTSSRAIVFDQSGQALTMAQAPTKQIFPRPGWVNQDATEIWQTQLATTREAVARAGIAMADVASIGITNQRETLVVWERTTGRPVHAAIVWQSRQSAPHVDTLLARGMGPAYTHLTGLVPDAYFTATKIAWLLEEMPDLRARAEAGELLAGTVDSWLIWNLTGGKSHITDVTNASRTMLLDLETQEWSPELLEDLAIPVQMLPEIVSSSGELATTSGDVLGAEIPITGIAGDQQAALFGQCCFAPGDAKNTYGTGSFLLMNTGGRPRRSQHRLLTTIAWRRDHQTTFALEGSIFVSGSAVQWLRDGLGLFEDSSEVEALAASVPSSEGVTFVPALTGLGAPHWDPAARGAIFGITRGTTSAHIARATLEAIALQVCDVIGAMAADSGIPLRSLRVDGGAARNNLLMQIQADLLGVPVVRPRNVETTATGAAYLAGLGCGLWRSETDLESLWEIDRTFEPSGDESALREVQQRWDKAVSRSQRWDTTSSPA